MAKTNKSQVSLNQGLLGGSEQFQPALTAAGDFMTANVDTNPDFFWALEGAEPLSFGVVVEVTIKAFSEISLRRTKLTPEGTSLCINAYDANLSWKGLGGFYNLANHFADNGLYMWYSPGAVQSSMGLAINHQVMGPLFNKLTADKPYEGLFAGDSAGTLAFNSGRLFTRHNITLNGNKIVINIKTAITAPSGGGVTGTGGHVVNPGVAVLVSDMAVDPTRRQAADSTIIIDGIAKQSNKYTIRYG
ncbi:uncharacterized protein BP5553_08335 [Venustampulla echinocandica]|uniref:Uncharacterized protein n=1 Tax=Venustampulla echinocandica TaxID=2656787 RepID=A0A370TGE1_9HELO|nr:uncharacterized protein BP5553_08335 [Venustampulla echinocandica]RDL33967.1 hypothetical protein BP5553_08335 [Venustampulla echinocandica]